MHVKWERRETASEHDTIHSQLVAVLVDGLLTDKSPEYEVLTELGAIQERFLKVPISKTRNFHQGLFWSKVDQKLKSLGLDEATYHKLESQLIEIVPRPGEDWALWGVTCIPHIDC